MQVRAVRSDCEGAIVEAVSECYTNGTYAKVPEFLGFQRREASSRTFLEADCEHGLLLLRQALTEGLSVTTKVVQAAEDIVQRVAAIAHDDAACFRTDSAHDSAVNEDLSQLPQWLPPIACARCEAPAAVAAATPQAARAVYSWPSAGLPLSEVGLPLSKAAACCH